jgi:glucose-6-phosphate isomerase
MILSQDTRHCALPIDAALAHLKPVLTELQVGADPLTKPLIDLACREDDLAIIDGFASELRGRFSHMVIAGAGGSGQSGRTLARLKPQAFSTLYILDNIDPDLMDAALSLNPADTVYLIISKSGSTVETLSQFYVLWEKACARLGDKEAATHFIIITMCSDSPLREAAMQYSMRIFDFEANIGGRFSVLSVVGLLPAAFVGLDIASLRKGACSVVQELHSTQNAYDLAPAIGAALQYTYLERDKNQSVMLPYADRLSGFSSWYRQSWAESLGKKGRGSTPIRAVGTTDQHSQLQLYLDGPKDKFFTFIRCDRRGQGQKINTPPRPDLEYLRGKTTGDVMHAEQEATLETLIRHGCPVRVMTLNAINETSLGALLMHFTLEIIFMSRLLGVNAFNQPAVEEGKHIAREALLVMGQGT